MLTMKNRAEAEGLLRAQGLETYVLSTEACTRCAHCTYPDAPCRFPERLHHALEGYGFLVHELAQAAGIRYNGGKGTVTFFGALLFGKAE